MVSIEFVVWAVVYLLIAGAVFGLLFFAVNYAEKEFPSFPLFFKCARIVIVIGGCFVLIGLLLSLLTGKPLIRWGP